MEGADGKGGKAEGEEGGGGGGGGGMGGANEVFRIRESSGFNGQRNRPLYVKLEMLLDLMFRYGL